jgi:hypothetical protein
MASGPHIRVPANASLAAQIREKEKNEVSETKKTPKKGSELCKLPELGGGVCAPSIAPNPILRNALPLVNY